eukprot:2509637-Amphidinium_carterae.1
MAGGFGEDSMRSAVRKHSVGVSQTKPQLGCVKQRGVVRDRSGGIELRMRSSTLKRVVDEGFDCSSEVSAFPSARIYLQDHLDRRS